MDKAKERILAAASGVVAPDSARIVFARGGRSDLVNVDRQTERARYDGRALPLLLRERWAIRSTIPMGDGTYFVLGRSARGGELDDPPSSRV